MRYTVPGLMMFSITAAVACNPGPDPQLAANKALVQRFTDAGNAADWAALDTLVAQDFVRHSQATAGPEVTSRAAFVELQKTFLATMPDQHITIESMVAEGDRVAVLATYAGTQTGPMGDIPATGRTVELRFLAIFRIADGMIAELWVEWDNVAMLTQLGLFPPPAPAD